MFVCMYMVMMYGASLVFSGLGGRSGAFLDTEEVSLLSLLLPLGHLNRFTEKTLNA